MLSALWIYCGRESIQVHKRKRYFFPNKYPWRLLLILHNTGWCHPHGNATEQAYAIPDYHVAFVDIHESGKSDVCSVRQTEVNEVNQTSLHVHLVSTHLFFKTSKYLLTKQNYTILVSWKISFYSALVSGQVTHWAILSNDYHQIFRRSLLRLKHNNQELY